MLKTFKIDDYKISYDTKRNQGTIADNGYSASFSINLTTGLKTSELIDKAIMKKLYNTVFSFVEWDKAKIFDDSEWKKRDHCVCYVTVYRDFILVCYPDGNMGELRNDGSIQNKFVIDRYDNIIFQDDLNDKELAEEIRLNFIEDKRLEQKHNCNEEYEEGPHGGAFASWADYYIWKNGSLTL